MQSDRGKYVALMYNDILHGLRQSLIKQFLIEV